MSETTKVKVYCGMNVYRTNSFFEEAGECSYEDILSVDSVDWEDGCVNTLCPICKNTLYQCDDHFEIV